METRQPKPEPNGATNHRGTERDLMGKWKVDDHPGGLMDLYMRIF
jgi:hypothetical protein